MNPASQVRGKLDWMLNQFQRATPGVLNALVVSADGLRVAATTDVDERLADQLSAATSGLSSLANGTAQLVKLGSVTQTIVEMQNGHLFVTQLGTGGMLAVVADRKCDMGMVGYEMTVLSKQVGHALTPAVREDGTQEPS